MSKRFIFPQQSGDRKKPRLDISVSDHNFPLSQNAVNKKASEQLDNWGDDIDDEILLQASQECEQACNSSILPEYSQFRRPALTSTQLPYEPVPDTSRGTFSFKKPTSGITNSVSTLLKDKCDRIASPLPGILKKLTPAETIDITDNYYNDAVVNTKDANYAYKELLKFKEENTKLKHENGKLLEKFVTKEGEATILRTQLKTFQVAVDNARLEKIKTQEQAQIEWSEKLDTLNCQLHDLQTQLDFKNLEILNMKEKCKMLESNKIKLTQVTVGGNEMSSHRLNNSTVIPNNVVMTQPRRLKTVSSSVQTESKPHLLKLSKPCKLETSNLTQILSMIMDSTTEQPHSILDYNEKLKRPTDFSPNKCRIFSTFHRLLSNSSNVSAKCKNKVSLSSIYEDLACIAANNMDFEKTQEQYINIFNATRSVLEEVQCQLETISRRLTSAFQKDMDKRYMESTTTYVVIHKHDLITGKVLFKEEQAILARRMTAILQNVIENRKALHLFNRQFNKDPNDSNNDFIELLLRICVLLDDNCCAYLYSGLLLSISVLIETLMSDPSLEVHLPRMLELVKRMISCRALQPVPCHLLVLMMGFYRTLRGSPRHALCSETTRNVKADYDQGVLLYKSETCLLQVLLKQVESSLKCMENQNLVQQALGSARDLLQFHPVFLSTQNEGEKKARCECGVVLVQILVYALRICSSMLVDMKPINTGAAKQESSEDRQLRRELVGVCRAGLRALHRCQLRDADCVPQRLAHGEGQLLQFCDRLATLHTDEFYGTMLTEVMGSFQAVVEEGTGGPRRDWLRTFDNFQIAD